MFLNYNTVKKSINMHKHALNCKKGGFVTMRHNNIRDFTANILSEVCNDVALETLLTPLSGEVFNKKSTTTEARQN